MLSKDQTIKISKALSYVLRHNPASVNIQLDENGWASVNELLSKVKAGGSAIDFDALKYVVETNDKKRFSFNKDSTRIRASQGHSIKIALNYPQINPPAILYHGTAEKFLPAILEKGLQKMKRHHVHLSADVETALTVGKRHGKPVILKIDADNMHQDGYSFYVSDNNVWLTDAVPVSFIEVLP